MTAAPLPRHDQLILALGLAVRALIAGLTERLKRRDRRRQRPAPALVADARSEPRNELAKEEGSERKRAAARAFTREDALVHLAGRARNGGRDIQADGGTAEVARLDVPDEAAVQRTPTPWQPEAASTSLSRRARAETRDMESLAPSGGRDVFWRRAGSKPLATTKSLDQEHDERT